MNNYADYSDDDLLLLLKDRDRRAWEYVYEQYKSMVVAYVLKNSGTQSDGEDMYIESLTILKSKIESNSLYQAGNNIKNLIYTYARNTWLDILKKRGKAPVSADNLAEEAEAFSYSAVYAEKLEDALRHIQERCKELILLKHYNKLPMAEIAEETGYSDAGSAKTALNRCMEKLRNVAKNMLKKD